MEKIIKCQLDLIRFDIVLISLSQRKISQLTINMTKILGNRYIAGMRLIYKSYNDDVCMG